MKRVSIQEDGRHILVEIRGRLDEECGDEVFGRIGILASRMSKPLVTINLDGLTGSDLLGRSKLIEMQRVLKTRNGRTAWLSRRPRFRGMALVVCHAAEDSGAKVVAKPALASEWLQGTGQRIEDARLPVERSMELVRARRKERS